MTAAVSRMVAEKKRLQKEKEEEVLRAETAERLTNMMKAQTTFDKYAFIFPKDESEIVREGKHLHHCVGRYAKEHFVYGSSIIVFVRDKTDRETPLYTLELKNNRIIQLRGERNKAADEEAKKERDLLASKRTAQGIQTTSMVAEWAPEYSPRDSENNSLHRSEDS